MLWEGGEEKLTRTYYYKQSWWIIKNKCILNVLTKPQEGCLFFPLGFVPFQPSSLPQTSKMWADILSLSSNKSAQNYDSQCQLLLRHFSISNRTDGSLKFRHLNFKAQFNWRIAYGSYVGVSLNRHGGGERVPAAPVHCFFQSCVHKKYKWSSSSFIHGIWNYLYLMLKCPRRTISRGGDLQWPIKGDTPTFNENLKSILYSHNTRIGSDNSD